MAGNVEIDEFAAFVPGDPNAGTNAPNAIAYSNNVSGAASTTLYAVTYGASSVVLARVGSPGGAPISPNSARCSRSDRPV